MLKPRKLLKASRFTVSSLAVLIALATASGAFAVIPSLGNQQILQGDGNYCPAEYHSCSAQGTMPYFAPDPFDYGAACDRDFLSWNPTTHTASPSSCYGNCDANNPTADCYVGCQDGYSSCLRGAFSLGARRVPLTTQNPQNTPNISGNIFRSCLANRIPFMFAAQYQQCLAEGKTHEECCAEMAASFP
jgi:hypothetical protein